MYFFGVVFLVATTLVFLFKKEVDDGEENFTLKETYVQMWHILWLMPIKKIMLILLTVKVKQTQHFNFVQTLAFF